jgi:hypothetical protein
LSCCSFKLQVVEPRLHTFIATSLFLCCERSFWHEMTMPGRQVRQANGGSVTLTCWPPAPLDPEGVDAQVLLRDVDLDLVVEFRATRRRTQTRVWPARAWSNGEMRNEAVDAGFGDISRTRTRPVSIRVTLLRTGSSPAW